MKRPDQIKAGICVLLVLVSVYLLIPTFQAAQVSAQQRAAAANDPVQRDRLTRIDSKAIRLGLDLQGGMYLVLEVDQEGLAPEQAQDALKRVVEVIRNRVDQFGVSEPVIQTQGNSRIIVMLPGLTDPQRAKDLIGRTARLEFKLVRPVEEVSGVLARLDEAFRATGGGATATPAVATPVPADSLQGRSLPALPAAPAGKAEDEAYIKDHPFTAYVTQDEGFARVYGTPMYVQEDEVGIVDKLLTQPAAKAMGTGVEFQLESEPKVYGDVRVRPLYMLNASASLIGDRLTNARSSPDAEHPGGWQVEMTLDRQGSRQFTKVTGENVGRSLAICLDNRVQSAPNIRSRIPSGKASITGSFTSDAASDLALVLRSGRLPATVHVEEERTIGPGLGRDSVHAGVRAGIVGTLAVCLFAIFYYRLTGIIAVIALLANALFLMAALAQFGLVLTLPGIAGIVLTIGMGVDANVLINERIREELRKNKTVRAAVDAGFVNAARTIIDSHVTTLFSGVILLWFGTGPIKGFAVTLSLGILINVFTSLVMTRLFMEGLARDPRRTSLSI